MLGKAIPQIGVHFSLRIRCGERLLQPSTILRFLCIDRDPADGAAAANVASAEALTALPPALLPCRTRWLFV